MDRIRTLVLIIPGLLIYYWPILIPIGAGLGIAILWHSLAAGAFLALAVYFAIIAFKVYHKRWGLIKQEEEMATSLRKEVAEKDFHVRARLRRELQLAEAIDLVNQLTRELEQVRRTKSPGVSILLEKGEEIRIRASSSGSGGQVALSSA